MRTLSEKIECGKRYVTHPDFKVGLDMLQEWIDECKLLEKQLENCNLQNVSNNEVAVCDHKWSELNGCSGTYRNVCEKCGKDMRQTDC
jgi:hypothetical protein